ncbi:NAD-dependent epimerase/dehydratase family protein, partial [Bacillus sp. HSTU-bmb18]
ERNLAWLKQRHPRRVRSTIADIRDRRAVDEALASADAVFHLAAQVAVTTSLVDPIEDFEINVGGAVNVLEAARRAEAPVIFASTNKVYG